MRKSRECALQAQASAAELVPWVPTAGQELYESTKKIQHIEQMTNLQPKVISLCLQLVVFI